MQGVVFLVLEQVVIDLRGEDAWDDVLDRAGDDGVYTAAGRYDAARLSRLLAASPGGPEAEDDRLRWFGECAVPHLVDRFPRSFAEHGSTVAFLGSVNHLVRDAVHRLHPADQVPVIDVHHDPASPGRLALGHGHPFSPRLCPALEGLVVGVARHYGERATVSQLKCIRRGASSCLTLCDLEAA